MRARSTIGTNSINTDTSIYTIFLGCGIKRERKKERGKEREYLAVHLMSVCICSNSLAADYRAASPRRVHLAPIPCRRPLPHFHPYSPISSALYLHPTPSLESIYHSTRGHGAVSRNRTRNVSKEAMYRQRNDSPLLARSFSCLFSSVSACCPLAHPFDTHFTVNRYYAAFRRFPL